jgi:PBSX family phage terminase large subunit
MQFHDKQKEVLRCIKYENPKILICAGAKRSGKTYVLTFGFLAHIAKFQDMGLSFIIGGSTQASIRRNILDDMEKILGKELKLNKSNAVEIFGNKVYCFDGANADAWKKVRGFTAAGAFLNEATALHDTFVKEVISRCSYEGARIYMDTNPENPMHTVKKDYIDKDGQRLDNNQLNIKAFKFTLYDNTFLNNEYVKSIEASTPSGMFFDRDILGLWVAAEGVVYKDFNKNIHYIKDTKDIEFKKYIAGVDFGWEHFGSIVVVGKSIDDKYYLLEEYAYQNKDIEYWIDIAKDIKKRYGNINFYCDHARQDYMDKLLRNGIKAINAKKDVLEGISTVATLFKTNRLFIVEGKVNRFKDEIYNYVWKSGKDEVVKLYDDVLDSLRYAIYSDYRINGKIFDRSKFGI